MGIDFDEIERRHAADRGHRMSSHPDGPSAEYADGTWREPVEEPAEDLELGPDGPRCPVCRGSQFVSRRTGYDRGMIATAAVLTGIGAVLSAQKRQPKVQCVTCGAFYDRVGQ